MSEATVLARIDALESSVQRMANALAAKADRTNSILEPTNPRGLQAACQAMANALAAGQESARQDRAYNSEVLFGISWQTGRLVDVLAPWDDRGITAEGGGSAAGAGGGTGGGGEGE